MSNAGLEAFTKSAAKEFVSEGIRINCVTSCPVLSNSLRYVRSIEEENSLLEEKMRKNIPLGRMANPDDIAKGVIFLCSQRSKGVTGRIIKIDGGRSLTSSGYVHYKGYLNMNSRFEPDGERLGKKLDIFRFFTRDKYDNFKIEDIKKLNDEEIEKFLKDRINQSCFSTNLVGSHNKIMGLYKKINSNDDKLIEKYTSNLDVWGTKEAKE